MSFYGTSIKSSRNGPRPLWPFYFLSVVAILAALMASFIYWPKSAPPYEDLVMTGGKMRTFMIRDDISNTGAGAALPIFTSVYIRFKDLEGEFRYPWTFPKYWLVRDRTGVYVDIWVEKAALGRDEAPLIWALEEHNEFKEADRQTIVRYEEILESQALNSAVLIKFNLMAVGVSIIFALIGVGVGRLNRKKYPDFYS